MCATLSEREILEDLRQRMARVLGRDRWTENLDAQARGTGVRADVAAFEEREYSLVLDFYNEKVALCQEEVGEWNPSDADLAVLISHEEASADKSLRKMLCRLHQICISLGYLASEAGALYHSASGSDAQLCCA